MPQDTDKKIKFVTCFGEEISEKEWNRAVEYLIQQYPEKTFAQVWEAMARKGNDWATEAHFGFGMGVRNTLR